MKEQYFSVIFVTLLAVSQSSLVESCHANKFTKKNNMKLPVNASQTIQRLYLELCWGECMWLPWCLSLNVRNISSDIYECDLNHQNMSEVSLVHSPSSDYYEITDLALKQVCSLYNCSKSSPDAVEPGNSKQTTSPPTTSPPTTSPPTTSPPTTSPPTNSNPTTQASKFCEIEFPRQSALDFVTVPKAFREEVTDFTLAFWLKVPSTYQSPIRIFSYKTQDATSELSLLIENDGKSPFLFTGSLGNMKIDSNFQRKGEWSHMVVQLDYNDHKLVVYKDRNRISKIRFSKKDFKPIKPNGAMYIGQNHPSDGFDAAKAIVGSIADLHMWNDNSMSVDEIYRNKCEGSTYREDKSILTWKKILSTSSFDGQAAKTCSTC